MEPKSKLTGQAAQTHFVSSLRVRFQQISERNQLRNVLEAVLEPPGLPS